MDSLSSASAYITSCSTPSRLSRARAGRGPVQSAVQRFAGWPKLGFATEEVTYRRPAVRRPFARPGRGVGQKQRWTASAHCLRQGSIVTSLITSRPRSTFRDLPRPLGRWGIRRIRCPSRVQRGGEDSTNLSSLPLVAALQKSLQAAKHCQVSPATCDHTQDHASRHYQHQRRQGHES